MLAPEIIANIAKCLDFRDKIELKKTCKYLSEIINITKIPDEYLDVIGAKILRNYRKWTKIVENSKYDGMEFIARDMNETQKRWENEFAELKIKQKEKFLKIIPSIGKFMIGFFIENFNNILSTLRNTDK